jgi:lactoylglutathione lyase
MTLKTVKKADAVPSRILYTMIRVGNLERSIGFYQDALGMYEVHRETFPDGRFTLVFMGYSADGPSVELTYNWDEDGYTHGTGFGHMAVAVANVYEACERMKALGVKVLRAAGPMMNAPEETGEKEVIAFIEDPDGYKIELIEEHHGANK